MRKKMIPIENDKFRSRAKKKYLRVTFPDGEVICYSNVTYTMIAALNRIGEVNFPQINLEMCHLPLLSREIYPNYKKYMKPICEGWYLNTQSNSETKYLQLKVINDQLNLGLKIEVGYNFETQKEPGKGKRSKIIDKLLIKMPNGEYIANDSALDTFLETIWQLGIDNIMKKDLYWGGNPLITRKKMANNQVQIGIDRWIVVPNSTKDKAKLLRVIGVMLRVKLVISII